jgi:ubiquitin carboxyl-terminal hydrolase 7
MDEGCGPAPTRCTGFLLSSRRFGGAEPLADDVVVASRLDSQKLYGHQERNCIGFVRENRNPRRTHAHLNARLAAWAGQEKQLRIRG